MKKVLPIAIILMFNFLLCFSQAQQNKILKEGDVFVSRFPDKKEYHIVIFYLESDTLIGKHIGFEIADDMTIY